MADYSRQFDFSAKSGQVILGSDVDQEFDAVLTAVNSKVDESREGVGSGIATLTVSALVPAGISGNATSGGGQLPEASETNLGAVELATTAEGTTGTDPLRAVTPAVARAIVNAAAGTGLTATNGVLDVDSGLDDIAALAKTDGNIIVGNGTTWVAESGATARTSLGLTIGTDVQAFDAHLQDIADIAAPTGADQVLVSTGAGAYALESGATLRTSLGLGTGDAVTFSTLSAGTVSGTSTVNIGSAVCTGPSADRLEVGGRVAFIHDNAALTSAEVFYSTAAPTTEGSDGDVYFEHEA